MGKREARKKEIVEQAFSTWSRECFAHTSLESVAKAMGMTKPALYRYFSGKEDLLDEMSRYFTDLFDTVCRGVDNGDGTFDSVFDSYNRTVIRFFIENSHYFTYAMVLYIPREKARDGEKESGSSGADADKDTPGKKTDVVTRWYRRLFPDELILEGMKGSVDRRGEKIGAKDIETVRSYIVSIGAFVLSDLAITRDKQKDYGVEDILSFHRSIVYEGLGVAKKLEPVDFEKVERSCSPGKKDLLEPDHIFTAIAEVVAENGLWNASLDTIAGKAGMRKSSLYFYFENRNDMLWKMIDRERHHVGELFLHCSGAFEKPEERLYAYFCIFGGYMAMRPDFLAVMNWFRIQRINFKVPNHAQAGMKKYIRFLEDMVEHGKLHSRPIDTFKLVRFIHFIIVNEINQKYLGGISVEYLHRRFRILFELFLYGVQGA